MTRVEVAKEGDTYTITVEICLIKFRRILDMTKVTSYDEQIMELLCEALIAERKGKRE